MTVMVYVSGMMSDPEVPTAQQESIQVYDEVAATQGLEGISLCDRNEGSDWNDGVTPEAETVEESLNEGNIGAGFNFCEDTAIDGVEDLGKLNRKDISTEELVKFHFKDVGLAFMFYNGYASIRGFSARKSKVLRNCVGKVIQQTFLCHKEGYRPERKSSSGCRQREPKLTTRCGCLARCVVHVEVKSGRWYIKFISDVHNHTFMDEKHAIMLPAHRKLSEFEKSQMTNMREVGIKTPHIYGVIANQAGGYNRVRFLKRDLYNEQVSKRYYQFSDASAALEYLDRMRARDDMLFVRHTVDEEGRLEHLFWCDGAGRRDFSVFGDVLAFDATYKKNKYLCPLVVFSGVNHHNMSIVFGSAIVGNEKEETYVWLLGLFIEAMGGKMPVSVITDGDVAMRNAIRKVLPNAHHRLCAWHLIRNATSNVKDPAFVSRFKHCMLGDFDVGEFNRKWEKLVADFGLEENVWVQELYQKRKMWATAYIRGKFFAGFRTTSRCEGLHSEFGKYVNSKNNLVEFLTHYFRWMDYMRYREVEADFNSCRGETVLQTKYESIELSASYLYTREVFLLFRPMIHRACACNVVGIRRSDSVFIYSVSQYLKEGFERRVTFNESTLEFTCSCERMESFGIPCEHMVAVMVQLNIVVLPEVVVLKRWTKRAKDSLPVVDDSDARARESALWCQYVCLVEQCKEMAKAAYEAGSVEYMRKTIQMVKSQTETLKALGMGEIPTARDGNVPSEGGVRDPARSRRKGGGGASSLSQNKGKKTPRRARGPTCGVCGGKGHKRHLCPRQRDNVTQCLNHEGPSIVMEEKEDEDAYEDCDFSIVDLEMQYDD